MIACFIVHVACCVLHDYTHPESGLIARGGVDPAEPPAATWAREEAVLERRRAFTTVGATGPSPAKYWDVPKSSSQHLSYLTGEPTALLLHSERCTTKGIGCGGTVWRGGVHLRDEELQVHHQLRKGTCPSLAPKHLSVFRGRGPIALLFPAAISAGSPCREGERRNRATRVWHRSS